MARPKKTGNELSQVQSDIEIQKEKLKKLQEKEKRLQEADNIRLGKLVKSVFKGKLPETAAEQKTLFEAVVKQLDSIYTKTEELASAGSGVRSTTPQMQTAGQVPQQTVINTQQAGYVNPSEVQ